MYQLSAHTPQSPPISKRFRFRAMHAICWPGLLIQLVMRLLAEQTQDADGWCEELDRQSRSIGFAWLYTGIFWLCFMGCVTVVLA